VQDGSVPVPAAYCDPHCHNDEGTNFPTQISYPENLEYHGKPVTLHDFKIKCFSNTDWCVFDHTTSLIDDPAQHRISVIFWSHSHAVNIQLTANETVRDDDHH